MRRALATLGTLLALVFSGLVVAVPPTAQAATSCTNVWLTAPSFYGHVDTGKRRCLWLDDTANGWTRIYSYDHRSNPVVDWAFQFTRVRPNDGRVESVADAARWVARSNGVNLQFAYKDLAGRTGCSGGFADSVSGAYGGSVQYPGQGLVRIGTGITDRCVSDRRTTLNVVKHEVAHAVIERICGETRPPMAGKRVEHVTTAYGMKYFGATMNAGGVEPTHWDFYRATKIHQGRCS